MRENRARAGSLVKQTKNWKTLCSHRHIRLFNDAVSTLVLFNIERNMMGRLPTMNGMSRRRNRPWYTNIV